MGVLVITCYRPKPGKDAELQALTRTHVPVLVSQGLAEDRQPLIGRAKDGTLVEIFVWKSKEAIAKAHANPLVGALWAKFAEVAEFVVVKDLGEASHLFAEFDFVALDPPAVGGRAPVGVDVEAGKTYFWCACGKSATQPFCDGSHKGSSFTPLRWVAPETRKVFLCACKRTADQPLCDGSHKAL